MAHTAFKVTNLNGLSLQDNTVDWGKINAESINVGDGISANSGKLSISSDILSKLDDSVGKIAKLEYVVNELVKKLEKYEKDPLNFLRKKLDNWELR